MQCDFCYSPDVSHIVPAFDFMMGFGHGSRGDWIACTDCALLIEKDDWEGLLKRAVTIFNERAGYDYSRDLTPVLRQMYASLRRHRNGPIRTIEKPPTK